MFIDSQTLFTQTIDNLESVAAYLRDEVDERVRSRQLTDEERRCKEALLTLSVLVPKLRAVQIDQVRSIAAQQLPLCTHCD